MWVGRSVETQLS